MKFLVSKFWIKTWANDIWLFFFQEMIVIKPHYKTYNSKLLLIFKAFKIWQHYFEDYKYKIFLFIDHKNLHFLINIKSRGFG